MKLSVLDIAQDVLSDMDSDEVNTITDTLESMQVARIIESTYFEMMGNKNWPHLKQLITLSSSGASEKPTHMHMPANTKELHVVNYDGIKSGETKVRNREIRYVTPDEFLVRANNLNSDNDIVQSVTDFSGVKLLIQNNTAPTYYTSFDDEWLVFNSFDSVVDTTLQSSKTQCSATISPTFTVEDSFVPDLPVEAFPGFLAEVKSVCFARLKQAPDAKSEQQSKRQKAWLSRKSWTAGEGIRMPDYGRLGRGRQGRDRGSRD